MCTLTKRRASGQEPGRALSQCWRSSQPQLICYCNIILILLTTLLAEALHLFNPLCSFFFITITAVAFTSALAPATHTLPKKLGKAPKTDILQSARTVSKCEIFDLFFPLNFDSLIPKTHFILLSGPSKMHFSCP